VDAGILKAHLLACLDPLGSDPGRCNGETREADIPAAVLIPILMAEEPGVLFTRRANHLMRHGGQISFPGGQIEAHDNGPVAAALREAREEIGLDPDRVSPVGRLSTRSVTSGYAVTPIVGLLPGDAAFAPNSSEVAEIFPVPLAYLLDSNHYQVQPAAGCHGRSRPTLALQYLHHRIWGATAAMLSELRTRWHRANPPVTLYAG